MYEYERISLNIPKRFHAIMNPYLEEDLDIEVTSERGSLTIVLTAAETLRHAASTSQKHRQKGT